MNGDDRASPLPMDIRALIEDSARGPTMPEEARRRVHQRMRAGFLAAGVGGALIVSSSTAGAAGAAGAARGASALSGFLARKAVVVTLSFVLGSVAGIGGYSAVQTRTTGPLLVDGGPPLSDRSQPLAHTLASSLQRRPTPPALVAEIPASAPTTVAQPIIAPPKSPSASVESSIGRRDADLAAERALIEMARNALSRGRPDQALEATRLHESRYPKGQLSEERESIAVHALVAAGRVDEARARADRFRARFPQSIFLPAIDAAVGRAP